MLLSRTSLRPAAAAAIALALVALATPAYALNREINPLDGATADHFGSSVAMDGDTLVVGAPGKGAGQGAVYVYTRTAGETWTQSAKLTASDGIAGDLLGYSVAIDGSTIVAGAPGDDGNAGSLYLFARTGAADRVQVDHLLASDAASYDALGSAVDIDGATIVAGAPGDDVVGPPSDDAQHGSVYTFDTTGTPGRFQSAKLTASDNNNTGYYLGGSHLGESVAIDGDTIVAGAPIDNFGQPTGTRRGSVYTFAATGAAARSQTAKLSVSGGLYGRLGVSVDIQGDTIVAGDDDGNSAFGTVYTFARTGAASRTETGMLRPANPRQNSGFGNAVSISDEFIAVGASSYSSSGATPAVGAGYVFTRTGAANRTDTWFTAGAFSSGDQYGTSIVTDGDRVVAGAPFVNASSPSFVEDQGRVYSSTPDLFVAKAGSGSGSISASSGSITSCTSSCTGNYLLGDAVTLTATASAGSSFAGWSNYSPCTGSTEPTCVVTMDGAPQVVATFTVGSPPGDTTPPTASIGSGPANGSTITTSSVAFGFSANETSTFTCSYDGAAFAPCTTPGPGLSGSDTRSGLTEGPHTFKVKATDTSANHNVSAEQTRSFTVDLPPPPPADTTPPQTTITSGPPRTVKTTKRKAKVTLAFKASEKGRFLCRVDGAAAKPCTSPVTFKLRVGKHTILVIAVDAAGNQDRSPATVKVKVKKKKN